MSNVANIVDGKVADTSNTTSAVKTAGTTNGVDKETFLQLLVAQMKYQDPLEPTSNTEYIAQYATFSQVEQLQSMSSTMNNTSAMTLVGKYVTMSYTTASGATSSISGRVDYVEKSGTDTYLYINGTPYNYDNLETVWDDKYLDTFAACSEWANAVNALPSADNLTLKYEESIQKLREAYDKMSSYEKSFIGSTLVTVLENAEKRIAELKAKADGNEENAAENSGESTTSNTPVEDTDGTV